METKKILDACCGGRAMWFDRAGRRTLFVDKRNETLVFRWRNRPDVLHEVIPDLVCDFTDLPFPDNTFFHVVFDPPHVQRERALGNVTKRYGVLNGEWREVIRKGFAECFRVLAPNGTLIFKWGSVQFPLKDILPLAVHAPLYGHQSGAKATTHWVAFLKP